jgi:putative transcriptional regulator
VGVARGTINAIETGKYDPSLPLAFKIARVFGKNVKEVFLYPEEQDTILSVYQHVETDQFRAPLNEIAIELLPDVANLAASRA